jgi:molecular chaperone Hsp33
MKFDQLDRYIFNRASIRGELVRLQDTLKPIIHSAEYPVVVQTLLAEMAAATSLLTATLKFEGEVGMQIQSKGIVKYAVINATHKQTLRGVARWDESIAVMPDTFAELVTNAVLVITITPEDGERYQGVVALDKPSLAECLEGYFLQSEQLATKVVLKTDVSDRAAPKAAGVLLQILPTSSENTQVAPDSEFEHLSQLTQTISGEELFTLPVEEILYRLYHQEEVELYPSQGVSFACTCSRERSANALSNVDKSELLQIIAEEGKIKVNCQYCHAEYSFDAIDVEAIHGGNFPDNTTPQ